MSNIIMTTNRTDLDKALKALTLDLKPTDKREADGRAKANAIFEYLRQKSTHSINRCYIGGSSGKKTAADDYADLDLVIFVNNLDPPFEHTALLDFSTVLSTMPDVKVIRKWPNSVQLKYGDFEIDLLAGANYVNLVPKPPFKILAAKQALETLQRIPKDPANFYHYGTSLAETQLEFVKQKSSFVHNLVRLSKNWNSKMKLDELNGRSATIELIAIKCGQEEEAKVKPKSTPHSLFDAFENFLKLIADFENLSISFDDFDPLKEIRKETSWRPCVSSNVQRRPYVIEPANPFHNFVGHVTLNQIAAFKRAARKTLSQLATASPSSVRLLFS